MSRRSPLTRVGALTLTLLLQVFVASALLHPCCLAMDMAGGHGPSGHAAASADVVHDAHGDHHEHHPVTDFGGGVAEGRHGASHTGHGHDGDKGSGCEGLCGFCCQVAGPVGLPATPAAIAAASQLPVLIVRPVAVPVRASDTAHLLPWANAPPPPRSISV